MLALPAASWAAAAGTVAITVPLPCADDGALDTSAIETLARQVERADAVIVGPGLGRAQSTQDFVMINHPVFFVDNPVKYADTLKLFHSGIGFETLGQIISVAKLPHETVNFGGMSRWLSLAGTIARLSVLGHARRQVGVQPPRQRRNRVLQQGPHLTAHPLHRLARVRIPVAQRPQRRRRP